MADEYDVDSILAKYGLGSKPERKSSLWEKISQPVKTFVGATGGALPGLLLGETDLYKEAKQRELEQLAAARGVTPEELTTAERVEALPGLGSVLTSADMFDNNVVGRIAKPVVRIAGDIAGDPTSFIGGAGAISKIGAIRKIARGAVTAEDAIKTLRTAQVLDEATKTLKPVLQEASWLDRATKVDESIKAAGEYWKQGKPLRAIAKGVRATALQEPFGLLPAMAYGPELVGGLKESVVQTGTELAQGNYGAAAESAASGVGLGAMSYLMYRGLKGDINKAREISALASEPVKTGAEAAAAYMGQMPERIGMQGPEFPPEPPPIEPAIPGYPPGPGADWTNQLPRPEWQQPAGPEPKRPLGPIMPRPTTGKPPKGTPVLSADQQIPGTTAAALVDPTGQGTAATLGGGVTKQIEPENQAPAPTVLVPPASALPGAAPEPAAASSVGAGLPTWLQQNIDTTVGTLKPEVISAIERLAAEQKTAAQIATELGLDVDTIRAVRSKLGIPSMTTGALKAQVRNPDFDTWLEAYKARTATTPATGEAPVVTKPSNRKQKAVTETPQTIGAQLVATTIRPFANERGVLVDEASTRKAVTEALASGIDEKDIEAGMRMIYGPSSMVRTMIDDAKEAIGQADEIPVKAAIETPVAEKPEVPEAPAEPTPVIEKPVAPAAETPAAKAVVKILDKVFDPAKPKSVDVTTSALTEHLGGAAAKRTSQSVSHLVNLLTKKAEDGRYRVLKELRPGEAEQALATTKGMFGPGQAPVLDAAYARIMAEGKPKGEAPKAEPPPVKVEPKVETSATKAAASTPKKTFEELQSESFLAETSANPKAWTTLRAKYSIPVSVNSLGEAKALLADRAQSAKVSAERASKAAAPAPTPPPEKPPTIPGEAKEVDPEALKATILEGVDLNGGDWNSADKAAARLRIKALPKDQFLALAKSLGKDKAKLDTNGVASVARALGLGSTKLPANFDPKTGLYPEARLHPDELKGTTPAAPAPKAAATVDLGPLGVREVTPAEAKAVGRALTPEEKAALEPELKAKAEAEAAAKAEKEAKAAEAEAALAERKKQLTPEARAKLEKAGKRPAKKAVEEGPGVEELTAGGEAPPKATTTLADYLEGKGYTKAQEERGVRLAEHLTSLRNLEEELATRLYGKQSKATGRLAYVGENTKALQDLRDRGISFPPASGRISPEQSYLLTEAESLRFKREGTPAKRTPKGIVQDKQARIRLEGELDRIRKDIDATEKELVDMAPAYREPPSGQSTLGRNEISPEDLEKNYEVQTIGEKPPAEKPESTPYAVQYFKKINPDDPEAMDLASAVIKHSNSPEFAAKAAGFKIDLANTDADIVASMLHAITKAIKQSDDYKARTPESNLDSIVGRAMNSLVGDSKLKNVLRDANARAKKKKQAIEEFNKALNRRVVKQGKGVEEGGEGVTKEIAVQDEGLAKLIEEIDPSGEARIALMERAVAKVKPDPHVKEAISLFSDQVDKYKRGTLGSSAKLDDVEAYMTANKIGGTAREFIARAAAASSEIERVFGAEESSRVKLVYDGQPDTNAEIRARAGELKQTLDKVMAGEGVDYHDLWRQVVRVGNAADTVSKYLKANNKSRGYSAVLESLDIKPQIDRLLTLGGNIKWTGDNQSLRTRLREALANLNPDGPKNDLPLPDGYEFGRAAKMEGKTGRVLGRMSITEDLWRFFSSEDLKISKIQRAMSMKDPIEALGKQVSGPRDIAGVPVRVFKQHPGDVTKIVLSLDRSTSRPSTMEGEGVKLGETPAEGMVPREGLPRIEEAAVTPNLPNLLGDFASKLYQTGSDRFLVSADLPDRVVKILDDPRTWDGLSVRAERLDALDSPDRVGYRLVPNEAGTEKSITFAAEKPVAKEELPAGRPLREVPYSERKAEREARARGEVPEVPPGHATTVKAPEGFVTKQKAQAELSKEAHAAGFLNVRDYLASKKAGGGSATTPRPTEGGAPKYQAEKVGESVAEWNKFLNEGTVPKIEKSTIEAAFPGRTVQEGNNSFSVQLPNGSTIFIHKTGFIAIDPEALKRGYGPDVNPDEWLAKGSFQTLGPDGLIKIVNGDALTEEVGHAMFSLGATNRQRAMLLKHYGDEESAIKAWANWHKDFKPEKDPTGLFAHIKRFFRDLYRRFKPTVDHTFQQMSSGKIWEQRADKIESDKMYSAVPRTQEEYNADMTQHELAKAIDDASDELARVFPNKVPKYLEPANLKAEQLQAALDDLSQLDITVPTKPGGGKGVLDVGFNSFRNLLPEDVLKHAKIQALAAKVVKSGFRYAERPAMRDVIDSVLEGVGRIDPVEMTNRVTALLNKEGKTREIEKSLAYIQRLSNTMYAQSKFFADKVLEAREKLISTRNPDGSVKPGISQEAYRAAQDAYDTAVQQSLTHNTVTFITSNADAGAASLLGRLLRQRSISRDMLDPAGVAKGRLLAALRGIAGRGNAALADLAHKKFLDEGDASGIVALAEAASKKDPLAMLLQYIKNGMLGPSSQTSNIVGNTGMHGFRLGEDKIAQHVVNRMLDVLASVTGKESIKDRKFMAPAAELITEATKIGNQMGFKQLAEDFSNIFHLKRLRTLPHEAIDVAEFPHQMGAIPGKKGEFISIPGKMMGMMDRFFQAKIRNREMMIEAYGQAVKDGHTGEALLAEARKNFKTLSDALDITNPNFNTSMNTSWVKDALDKVIKQTAENTFQASLHGTMFEGMEKILQKHRGLQFIIPFYRTPANIFLQTLKRTPVGFFMKGSGEHGALMARDIAKPLLGTSMMMLFYSLAETGDLTGGGSIDPEMRENQKQTGWLPYSARFGDTWYTYNRLEPVSSLVGIAADLHEAVNRGDIHSASSLISRGLQIVQNNLTNKTFLSGVSNFMTAYSDPERYGERLAKGLSGMLVPNVLGPIPVGSLSRAADPVYRQTTVLTEPLSKIPGMSESFPGQATSMGEPRLRPGSFLSRLAFPGQVSEVRHDKGAAVAGELDRIGIAIRPPKRTERMYGASVEYTPHEFELMKKAHRDATSEVYARLKSGGLRSYPDNEDDPRYVPGGQTKKEIIRGIYEKHRNRVRSQISPYVQRRARGLLKQRQQEARDAG